MLFFDNKNNLFLLKILMSTSYENILPAPKFLMVVYIINGKEMQSKLLCKMFELLMIIFCYFALAVFLSAGSYLMLRRTSSPPSAALREEPST